MKCKCYCIYLFMLAVALHMKKIVSFFYCLSWCATKVISQKWQVNFSKLFLFQLLLSGKMDRKPKELWSGLMPLVHVTHQYSHDAKLSLFSVQNTLSAYDYWKFITIVLFVINNSPLLQILTPPQKSQLAPKTSLYWDLGLFLNEPIL